MSPEVDLVPCPTCGVPVPPEQCSHGVGECPSCGRLFDLAEAAAAPPASDLVPPDGVTRLDTPDGVELVVRWSADVSAAGHVVQLLFPLALAALVVAGSQAPSRTPGAGSAGGGWVVAGLVGALVASSLYGAVSYLTNHTTFRLTPEGVVVRHGPLPCRARPAHVAPTAARRARVERVEESVGRGGKQTRYQLEAGGAVTTGWVRPTALEYVAAVLRGAYATQAAPGSAGLRTPRGQAESP